MVRIYCWKAHVRTMLMDFGHWIHHISNTILLIINFNSFHTGALKYIQMECAKLFLFHSGVLQDSHKNEILSSQLRYPFQYHNSVDSTSEIHARSIYIHSLSAYKKFTITIRIFRREMDCTFHFMCEIFTCNK